MRSGSYIFEVCKGMCMDLEIEHPGMTDDKLEEILNNALCSKPKCDFDIEFEEIGMSVADEDGVCYSEIEFTISYQTRATYVEATRWDPGDYEEDTTITDDDIEEILKKYFKEHDYKISVYVHECSSNYNEW